MRVIDWLAWRLACRLNRPLPWRRERPAPATFTCGGGVDVLAATSDLPSPELCVVITTYARVAACDALLRRLAASLERAGLSGRCFVVVVEDRSDHDYAPVRETLERHFAGRFVLYTSSRRLAKPGRWLTYQRAFDVVRRVRPSFTLFLEDDAVFGLGFVADALAAWHGIDDPTKAVLYLCSFEDDEQNGRWVNFARRPASDRRVRLTQWFDLHAFLVDASFFGCLGYRMLVPPASRWQARPQRSSGVSEQFTRRLFGRKNVYQVVETLARHGGLPSVLNQEARAERALDNTRPSDRVD
jgi:hypothetical protein